MAAIAAGVVWAQEPKPQPEPAPDVSVEVRAQLDRAREQLELAREKVTTLDLDLDLRVEPLLLAQTLQEDIQQKIKDNIEKHMDLKGPIFMRHGGDVYSRGLDALDQRNYERALKDFDEYLRAASGQKESRADGALYWKAYSLNKLSRRDEALASLAQMEKTYPSSRWLNDAKALQIEINQNAGKPASPENWTDEDLKLLALNSLVNTDAERTVPLLEKLLADPKATPRLKSRALFVLAQSRNPKAGEIITKYAKGAGNPDVQLKAVEYLGVFGAKQNQQTLAEIYGSTSDPALKRAVLRGYLIAKDKDHLLAAAKSESNQDLRQEAVRDLGALGGQAELAQMYGSEKDANVKREIIHAFAMKREKAPVDTIVSLYSSESDKNLKREMLRSLRAQGAAKQLVDIARKETDPGLKQEAVRELSNMHSKEAQDYMMELLNK
jgi:hypothetical protein